jgi:predicted nucleotidyltransferase
MNEFGLFSEVMAILENSIRSTLGKKTPVIVWIFGSRATKSFRPYSDVDLLFECEELNAVDHSKMDEMLENSSILYKVDCVDSKKLAKEYFSSVHATKKLLFQFL